ncbi:amidophosphoribosyltransferase [Halanaerobium praevalens]|uniref:Amidophosphoribosyltransferase n=1 Tax=Halanaerobium praevalens (strain ATCC 33744 / DSM 2228 / GSL) TaxID=572479 RepID=E3DMC0_HALPG|nr:amidophosphoribosyltransferase [Halanaerobium praevalens]ADO76313.1 amidophosphoribosyltransferase [Halanaerobium praevalens DSM 2228]
MRKNCNFSKQNSNYNNQSPAALEKKQSKLLADKMTEECGVFGIFNANGESSAAELSYYGLIALQHRGQESAGICANYQGEFNLHKGMGLVESVFEKEDIKNLKGEMAIGHVRYSTSGSSKLANAQPILINSMKGDLALAHNGNLANGAELRNNLESNGSIFHSTLDTEVIAHLVARSFEDNIVEALSQSLHQLKGAFSLVAMTKDQLIAIRDPSGFRPLSLGKLNNIYVVASESCAFDIIGAEFVRDIEPGEIVVIDQTGIKSRSYSSQNKTSLCVFEYIYFARPDSKIAGQNVLLARKEMGKQLAREMDVEADIVVPVPDSGIAAALGFAAESGIPYAQGILRNRYMGRTFIQPTQAIRDLKVRLKLSPIKEIIKDQRVVLIDDSIVRGTTSKQIIGRIKEAGAKEVHLAISSPPVEHPCYFGLDTSRRQELIASRNSIAEIAKIIGADSLHYLSQAGMLKSIQTEVKLGFCTACFDGDYPIESRYLTEEE